MTESDGFEAPLRQDKPIAAHPAINPGMQLVGATRIVRVEQDEFHVPLIQRFHLLGAAEPKLMLLETAPGFGANALLFHLNRDPIEIDRVGLCGGTGRLTLDPREPAFIRQSPPCR